MLTWLNWLFSQVERDERQRRRERRMEEAQREVERIQEEYNRRQRRMGDEVRREWEWYEFQGWREGRDELRRGITAHAFNMVDFILLTKKVQQLLSLSESIFYYPETKLEVFYKNKNSRKKCKIHLNGFEGASWFDYQIQLTRFLPKNAKIIEITIIHHDSKMVVVFLPSVFVQKRQRIYKCSLLTVDTKTGDATWGTNSFTPSTYNPRIEGPKDYEYLF